MIRIYDTTLRDGCQAEDIHFSLEDKLRIAKKIDELGIHYIEGGWPGSNPKDLAFFERMKGEKLRRTKLAAFGSTAKSKTSPGKDPNIKAILKAETPVTTIVGKSWDFHVTHALEIDLKANLDLINNTLRYLKGRVDEVIFDAEHFFDGYKANPDYALKTLLAAEDAGVDCICLCDTNGGTMPMPLYNAIFEVQKKIDSPLGIHTHNDSGLAVANSILAVELGINHVQGTINGFGERCGNADLCSVIPNIQLKLGRGCIPKGNIKNIRELSRFVYEMANIPPHKHQPYVGESAFTHKGGIHVSAIRKNPETYEHIRPGLVGNTQRVLVSDLAGRSNIEAKAKEFGLKIHGKDPRAQSILKKVKDMENQGYQFEGADASFELLIKSTLKDRGKFFKLKGFRVINEKRVAGELPYAEATIMVEVGDKTEHTAAMGVGPVNALDNALRKALERFYPSLKEVKLLDYKVRVLPAGKGTASQVRVLIESGDGKDKWGTVGVSENIIEASYEALVDSIDYKLYKDEKKRKRKKG